MSFYYVSPFENYSTNFYPRRYVRNLRRDPVYYTPTYLPHFSDILDDLTDFEPWELTMEGPRTSKLGKKPIGESKISKLIKEGSTQGEDSTQDEEKSNSLLRVQEKEFGELTIKDNEDGSKEVKVHFKGFDKNDVSLDLDQKRNNLVLKAKKVFEDKVTNDHGTFTQIRNVSFSKTIPLHGKIDPQQIKADFTDGDLLITLPKPESIIKNVIQIPVTSSKLNDSSPENEQIQKIESTTSDNVPIKTINEQSEPVIENETARVEDAEN